MKRLSPLPARLHWALSPSGPQRCTTALLEGSGALSQAHGLPVANVFHAGDGNLHPLILFDAGRPGEVEHLHLALASEFAGTWAADDATERLHELGDPKPAAQLPPRPPTGTKP